MKWAIAFTLGLGAIAAAVAEPAAPAPVPNLFATLLGKSEAQLDVRLAAEWQQLFYGDDATQRVFYPLADGTGYIADIANADVRTEGLSYGMMIAVQLDHRPEFDQLWAFARRHLYHADGPERGYFAWHAAFDGHPLEAGPAPDGEEWFATALFFASGRWGNRAGGPDYGAEAQAILRTMLHKHEEAGRGIVTDMFDPQSHLAVFAPDATASKFGDPSYELPAFYELWARWAAAPADRAFFAAAAEAARANWARAADPRTGLMPDYANFDGTPHPRGYHANFASDAWRTLGNPALDWAWWRADPAERTEANRVLTFLGQFGVACPNRFQLDGTPLSSTASSGLFAMGAVAGLAADPAIARPWVQRLWDLPIPDGRYRYYDGLLGLLALLETGGRFHIYPPQK
jgi:oligosaccharide reducing-end xylanase